MNRDFFNLQKPKKIFSLQLTETPSGKFHRCLFQGIPITEEELLNRILKVQKKNEPISKMVLDYSKQNRIFNLRIRRLKSVS